MADTIVQNLLDEWHERVDDRKPYEVVWDAIGENLLPDISRLGSEGDSSNSQRGDRRDSKIIDGSPRLALSTFQAGLQGRLMDANFDWVSMRSPDEDLNDDREVRMWLSKVNAVLAMLFTRSRFYPECYTMFGVAGGLGTGTTYREYDRVRRKAVFSTRNPWEMYFGDDANGENDTVFRLTMMEPKNMVLAFQDGTLSEQVTKAADSSSEKRNLVRVLHAVTPNPDYDPRKRDRLNMRCASFYIDVDHTSLIRRGGFRVNPYSTWRLEKEVNESYGRGPGWRALCDIKGLYAYARTDILAAQLAVNPPLDIPAERRGNVNYVPGGHMYYDELNRDIKVLASKADIKAGLEREAHKQDIINRHFMVPFFTAMQQIGGMDRERTAYEVRQIEQEMAILLGPYAMGFQIQYMDTVVEGLFWDAMDNGLIPPPPRKLVESQTGQKLEVAYSGPLAQAQRNFFNSEPYRRTLADIQAILSVDPTGQRIPTQVLDNLDWDRVVREMAQANGLPEEAMFDEDIVKQVRAARQKSIERQQQMAMLESAGKAATGLNQAPQPGSPAEEMNKQRQPVGARR